MADKPKASPYRPRPVLGPRSMVAVGAVTARGGPEHADSARALAHRVAQVIGDHGWQGSAKIEEMRVKISANALAENPNAIARAVRRALGGSDG